MGRKIGILLGAFIVFVIAGIFVFLARKTNNPDIKVIGDAILYRRLEGWGPCPSEEMSCSLDTYLYKSGKLVFSGDTNKEVQLDSDVLQRIIREIEISGVWEKDCSGPIILDYAVEYEININGKIKKIGLEDTSCWDELRKVNGIIDSYKDTLQGGS